MLMDGFKLLVIGMGTVYLFLALMVVVINVAAKALAPYASAFEQPKPAAKPRARPEPGADGQDAPRIPIAAIAAAIHQHRKDNGHA